MSIQNELSSEIAVALLARGNNNPKQLDELKKVVLKIRSILQETNVRRDARLKKMRAAATPEERSKS
jgi:hypothetical protein